MGRVAAPVRATHCPARLQVDGRLRPDRLAVLRVCHLDAGRRGRLQARKRESVHNTVPVASFVLGGIAVLLLLSAMTNRSAVTSGGTAASWEPPLYFSLISVVLVVAVLVAGYLVHSQLPGGHA